MHPEIIYDYFGIHNSDTSWLWALIRSSWCFPLSIEVRFSASAKTQLGNLTFVIEVNFKGRHLDTLPCLLFLTHSKLAPWTKIMMPLVQVRHFKCSSSWYFDIYETLCCSAGMLIHLNNVCCNYPQYLSLISEALLGSHGLASTVAECDVLQEETPVRIFGRAGL